MPRASISRRPEPDLGTDRGDAVAVDRDVALARRRAGAVDQEPAADRDRASIRPTGPRASSQGERRCYDPPTMGKPKRPKTLRSRTSRPAKPLVEKLAKAKARLGR